MRLCWFAHAEDLASAPSPYHFVADNECRMSCLLSLLFSEAAMLLTWKHFPTIKLSIRTRVLFKMMNNTRCLLSVWEQLYCTKRRCDLDFMSLEGRRDSDFLWHWLIHGTFALLFTSSSWSRFRLHFHYSSTLGEESSANIALTRKPQRMKRPFIAVMMPCSSPLQLHFENKRLGGKVAAHKQNLQLRSHRGLVQMGLMQMPENIIPIDTREQQKPKL